VLEGCGHVPQVELPETTNRLIRELIRESTVPAAAEGIPLRRRARSLLGRAAAL
jgi:hypothetical protein